MFLCCLRLADLILETALFVHVAQQLIVVEL